MPDCDPTENYSAYYGRLIADPWDDDTQTDWRNMTMEEVSGGLGVDQGVDELSGAAE